MSRRLRICKKHERPAQPNAGPTVIDFISHLHSAREPSHFSQIDWDLREVNVHAKWFATASYDRTNGHDLLHRKALPLHGKSP
jgi:hypothetical protein